jgi:hypothetical protein
LAEVSGFENLITLMTEADAFTLLLPFLLSFLVFKWALDNVDLFGDNFGNFSPVIALILAFFTARFITLNPFYQTFFVDFFGKLVVGVVGIIGFGVLLAFSGYDLSDSAKPVMVLVMISIVGAAFVAAGGFGPAWIEGSAVYAYAQSLALWSLESGAIWVAVIGGVLLFATSGGGSSDASLGRGLFDNDYMKKVILGNTADDDYND